MSPRGARPRDGVSLCAACRAAGAKYPAQTAEGRAKPRVDLFDEWFAADAVLDPAADLLVTQVWGAYVSWVVANDRDVDLLGGRVKFLERLEAKGAQRKRTRHSRRVLGVRPRRLDEGSATMGSTETEAASAP